MTQPISILQIPDTDIQRISTGMKGLDEFLGGGLVPGTAILFAGEPGVGKSTLLLQIAYKMASTGKKVLYATGEESLAQIKIRANRINALHPNILCTENIQLEAMMDMAQAYDTQVVIVDSIQMAYSDSMTKEPGSKSQITYCINRLIDMARTENRTLITVGHSTKSGTIAGMQSLQHMVDITLYMYTAGGDNRRLFAKKNRYGPAQVNWDIQMKPDGIIDPKYREKNKAYQITKIPTPMIAVPDEEIQPGRELVVPYERIQHHINQGSFLDRYSLKKDMEWMLKKEHNLNLDSSIEYDIIYKLKD